MGGKNFYYGKVGASKVDGIQNPLTSRGQCDNVLLTGASGQNCSLCEIVVLCYQSETNILSICHNNMFWLYLIMEITHHNRTYRLSVPIRIKNASRRVIACPNVQDTSLRASKISLRVLKTF